MTNSTLIHYFFSLLILSRTYITEYGTGCIVSRLFSDVYAVEVKRQLT